MTAYPIQVGQTIGDVIDAATGELVTGRVFVEAQLEVNSAAAQVNADIEDGGAAVRVRSASIKLDAGDEERLQAAERERAASAPAASTGSVARPLAPGTSVLVTWDDGKTYPAAVRDFNGTHYAVVWDGSAAWAWVPTVAVKPR
jgi:hypothetical protein